MILATSFNPGRGFRALKTNPSYKILIADDEFLVRWSLTQGLSQNGHSVTAVENGKKAIEAAQVECFDFVITDLKMPELDGWQVLETLHRTRPSCRVIIITAHGEEESEKIAKEKGAWADIEKPYVLEKLRELLETALKEECR